MKGFYINLKHREDRKKHIEDNIIKYSFFSNIERMDAIYNNNGDVGCGLSHIKCINELKKLNDEYYLILEDDFQILNEHNFLEFEKKFEKIKNLSWDLIVLTPSGNTIHRNYYENFHRINNNQTTTAYIIKHEMLEIIENLFNEGVENLLKNKNPHEWVIDQIWKRIQNEKVFLYYKDIFAGQLPGYSDIGKRMVNNNARFINQINY